MAYKGFEQILELATWLQASSVGLTLKQMIEETVLSPHMDVTNRATIYRMLSFIDTRPHHFGELIKRKDDSGEVRYRLERMSSELFTLEAEERAMLEVHARQVDDFRLRGALTKVLAQRKGEIEFAIMEIQDLIDRTAHTGFSAPRSQINQTQITIIQRAITDGYQLAMSYLTQDGKKVSRTVNPLGMLFGRYAYLVASTGNRAPITYRVDCISDARVVAKTFQEREGWNFKEWSEQSFGVFHGDAKLDVKIRFSKDRADRAKQITFHPQQKTEELKDGTYRVSFSARGHREMVWELMHPDWIGHVRIEAPEQLKNEYLKQLDRAKAAIE